MPTAYITHPACRDHDTGPDHPENASRLFAIEDRFVESGLDSVLRYVDAPLVSEEQLRRVHPQGYIDAIRGAIPESGYARLDPDTVVCPKSLDAAYRAAGRQVAGRGRCVRGTRSGPLAREARARCRNHLTVPAS